MDSKKKFGLVISKKTGGINLKGKSVFDNSDEETLENSSRPKIPQSKTKIITDKSSVEDPSIYEYDSIYDDMKAQEIQERAPKEKQNSRYIDTLLKAAEKRKKEYERRVERKVQVEREKEGDKYKDKESFVTSSYKKKMQEMEEEEERERRENEINEMMDVTKQKDLSGFYRHFLKQTVGEEKIPIYGETQNIKEEVLSESETENFKAKNSECVADSNEKESCKVNTEINYDSDSVSSNSSSDEENDKLHSNKKQSNSSRVPHTHKKSNIDRGESLKKKSPVHSHAKKNFRTNDSDISNKVFKKRKHHDFSENIETPDSSDENSGTQPSETPSAVSVLRDSSVNFQKETNIEVKSKSQNIFIKRTVDIIFDEAQARYFKRMAERDIDL